LLPEQVDDALRALVAHGRVTCDGFAPIRRLLARRLRPATRPSRRGGMPIADGRWSIFARGGDVPLEDQAMHWARTLLGRYGILFRDLLRRECLPLSWRELRLALTRMEARGEIRGGHLVAGVIGEQFALPLALERLREERGRPHSGESILLSVYDPLDLRGVLPSLGPRGDRSERDSLWVDGIPAPNKPCGPSLGARH
jgi:ATP-dependent Lhr-like helicase